VALQRAFEDYEESALSVDEESSTKRDKKKKKKCKSNCGRRGGSNSRYCSQSLDHSQLRDPREKKKCKHCKEDRPYTMKHDTTKCFYNKKYKGWRPSKICKEMGIMFKSQQECSPNMGGFGSSALEESSRNSKASNSLASGDTK
jgi:hypothetical protein